MKKIVNKIRIPLLITVVMLVLCGVIYPLTMTVASQVFFPHQANGSLITVNGTVVGSQLLGQDFKDDRFLQGRPSLVNYNTYPANDTDKGSVASGSSNLALSNEALTERIEQDIQDFLLKNPTVTRAQIPADLVMTSASGLDPDISVQSALIQIPRIAEHTGISETELREFIKENTHKPIFGIMGEETVNVLQVNLEIARLLNII